MSTNQFGKKGWTPERLGNLSGKTFLITGTTSGTGFEATRILLSKGAKVVMLNRNPKKAAWKKQVKHRSKLMPVIPGLPEQTLSIQVVAS